MYCAGSKANLPLIKSSIASHGLTTKHAENLATFLAQNKGDDDRKLFLTEYYTKHNDHEGADVDAAVKADRFCVVETMMGAGVALNTIDRLRLLLERGKRMSHP